MTTPMLPTLATCLLVAVAGCTGTERVATRAQGAAQALSSRTLSVNDATFLDVASRSGIEAVTFSQLARREASRAAVKSYALRLMREHTTLNQQLIQLAGLKGIDPPTAMDSDHAMQYNELAALNGQDFEHAYLNAQATDQMAMLKLFREEERDGADPDVKAFAAKTTPTIQAHLDLTHRLGGRIMPPAAI